MEESKLLQETNMDDLIERHDVFLFDADGVLTSPYGAIMEAFKILDYILQKGKEYYIISNNGFVSREGYSQKINKKYGILIPPYRIIVASYRAGQYLKEYYPTVKTVYVLGNDILAEEIKSAGFNVIGGADHDSKELESFDYKDNKFECECDAVVVCKDSNFNAYKLYCASFAIQKGAIYLGTSEDPYFMIGDIKVPDTGSYLKCLTAASGKSPIVIGKPHHFGFKLAKQKIEKWRLNQGMGESPKVIMFGDTLYTDILGARQAGIESCLVFSGNTSKEEVMDVENKYIPNYIMPQLDHWKIRPF